MRVTGFNHFAIDAVDYESSLFFYRGVLGFKQLATVHTPESSSTNLSVPGGCVVELIDRHGSAKGSCARASAAVHHLAFDVEDVEASEAELRKRGVDIVVPCTILEAFNTKVVQSRDPSGVIIAFRKNLR